VQDITKNRTGPLVMYVSNQLWLWYDLIFNVLSFLKQSLHLYPKKDSSVQSTLLIWVAHLVIRIMKK